MSKQQGSIEELTSSSDDSDDDTLVICDTFKSPHNMKVGENAASSTAAALTPAPVSSTIIINTQYQLYLTTQGPNISSNSSDIELLTKYDDSAGSRFRYILPKQNETSNENDVTKIFTLSGCMPSSNKLDVSQVKNQNNEKEDLKSNNKKDSNSIEEQVSNVTREKCIDKGIKGQHSLKYEDCNIEQSDKQAIDSGVGINKLLLSLKKETFKEEIPTDEESDGDVKPAMDVFGKVMYHSKPPKIRTKRFMQLFCTKCNDSVKYKRKCSLVFKKTARCRSCLEYLCYQCKICQEKFTSYSSFIVHLKRDCIPDEFWRCVQCNYVTVTQDCLLTHVEKIHGDSKNIETCKRCKKSFKLSINLAKHMMNCKGKDKSLKINKRKSTDTKKVEKMKNPTSALSSSPPTGAKCSKKNDVSDVEKSLSMYCAACEKNTNIKKPDNNKNCTDCSSPLLWQCGACDQRSVSYCGIYDHLQNECNKLCKFCDKKFSRKNDLQEHQNSCSNISICCKLCKFQTKNKYTYKNHLKMKHNKENIKRQ